MLTSLPFIKSVLNVGLTDLSQDNWLLALQAAAEAAVKSYCNRDLESNHYVESYNGTSARQLVLRQRPVTAVNNVWVDFSAAFGTNPAGAFTPDTLLVLGTDYAPDWDSYLPGTSTQCSRSGVLYRLQTIWQEVGRFYYPGKLAAEIGPAYGIVKVDYQAGYPAGTAPPDLQYAVAYLVAFMKRAAPIGGPLLEEQIGDYRYKVEGALWRPGQYPELGTVNQVLNRYKECQLGLM